MKVLVLAAFGLSLLIRSSSQRAEIEVTVNAERSGVSEKFFAYDPGKLLNVGATRPLHSDSLFGRTPMKFLVDRREGDVTFGLVGDSTRRLDIAVIAANGPTMYAQGFTLLVQLRARSLTVMGIPRQRTQ